MTDQKRDVSSLTGMVEATGPVQLGAARTEDHCCSAPAALSGFSEQALDIMRLDRALQTVKQDQERSVVRAFEVMDVQEIAIRRVEPLQSGFVEWLTPEKLAP
jgi:hypothetical protein